MVNFQTILNRTPEEREAILNQIEQENKKMTAPANFNFDPSTVSAIIEVFPKDEYEFEVNNPKPFFKLSDNPEKKPDQYGVRFSLKVTRSRGGAFDNKKTVYTGYMHTEGSQSFTKGFIMACYGYDKNKPGQQKFNNDFAAKDWSYDPDNGTVGEVWKGLDGARVIGSLDTQPNINDPSQQMQQFKNWRSITSGDINLK